MAEKQFTVNDDDDEQHEKQSTTDANKTQQLDGRLAQGCTYHKTQIEWPIDDQRPLGLGIRQYKNRVIVSNVVSGSLADSSQLHIGDHIIDVDSKRTGSKNVARAWISKALQVYFVCVPIDLFSVRYFSSNVILH